MLAPRGLRARGRRRGDLDRASVQVLLAGFALMAAVVSAILWIGQVEDRLCPRFAAETSPRLDRVLFPVALGLFALAAQVAAAVVLPRVDAAWALAAGLAAFLLFHSAILSGR